jgi:hypothetical protein
MPDHVSVKRAVAAGLAGTGAVVGGMAAARRMGQTRLEFPRLIATVVGPERPATRAGAWAFFVANGVLLALGYRIALHVVGGRASVSRGAAMGLAHGAVAGASAALLSPLHPRARDARLVPPGRSRPEPRTLAVIVAVHVLYGAVLGAMARGRVAAGPLTP